MLWLGLIGNMSIIIAGHDLITLTSQAALNGKSHERNTHERKYTTRRQPSTALELTYCLPHFAAAVSQLLGIIVMGHVHTRNEVLASLGKDIVPHACQEHRPVHQPDMLDLPPAMTRPNSVSNMYQHHVTSSQHRRHQRLTVPSAVFRKYVPQNGCRVRATGCLKACGLTLKPNPASSVAPDGPYLC
jgi:hypothetical protein